MAQKYDVAIIGAGPGGYMSAFRLRQLGKNVCVVDMDEERLGGVCLNEGCIPTKSLLNSAKLFSAVRQAKDFGIEAKVRGPDIKKMVAYSRDAVLKLRNGLKGLFKKYGVELISGMAKLVSPNSLSVKLKSGKEETIEADKIIVATGSNAKIPPNVEIDGKAIITSSEAIKLEKIPSTLLIAGAGTIGVEFCSLFTSLGSKVTLVEMMPKILPFEDEELSKELADIFKKRGVELFVNTTVKSLGKRNNAVEAILDVGGAEQKMRFESVLMAMGRKPNTDGIGLEEVGVKLKEGFIAVDDRMRTNIDSIYAVGDVINTLMYAHVAYKEGVVAAEDIAGIKAEKIDYHNMPRVIFSEPQVASVGLEESEAKELGSDIEIFKYLFRATALAVVSGRSEGFIKIIVDKESRTILGAHIIGGDATEMIHEFVLARNSKLKIDDIAKAVHAHPTFSEITVDAVKAVFSKPVRS